MPSGRHYPRTLRVNEVLRQVVAEELERLADVDERLRLVTVTSVEVSPDLRTATVYVATLRDEVAAALEERRAQIQRAVGKQVRMKHTPRFGFAADPAISAGARVEEILRRLGEERSARRRGARTGRGRTASDGSQPR